MKKNSISRTFIEVFEPTMISEGFIRKGKVFHRIVNEKVIQLVSYYRYALVTEFTIQFSICPLSLGWDFDGPYYGHRMFNAFIEEDCRWNYERAEGYIEYMPIALEATKKLLLPKLNTEIDYESYYKSYKESKLFTMGWDKMSFTRYMLALIFEDYEDAQKTMENFIEHRRENNRINFGTEHHISPEWQKRFDQECEDYRRMKEAMDNGDRKTIEGYMETRKQQTLNSYVKNYSTPKKYEKYLETGVLPFEVVNI